MTHDRPSLPAAAARARGLRAHLFERAELERLAGLDVAHLAAALARSGRLEPIAEPAAPETLEASARRTAAKHLALLARWGAGATLDFFWADHDRRIARALLRGAAAGIPAEARLAGLVPTPFFTEGALAALAREPSPARVASHLVLLDFAGASRLLDLATRAHPVPFELDLELLREFGERCAACARAGDRNLREVIAWKIDVLNAATALAFAASPRDVKAVGAFLRGGAALRQEAFAEACAADSTLACSEVLARALGRSPLAKVLRDSAGDAARFEHASFAPLFEIERRCARLEPLSSAPLVSFLLRLEAQSADLGRLAWAASLGAPPALVTPELETPWS